MTTDTLDSPVTTTDSGTQAASLLPVAETTAPVVEQGAQATASADTPPAAESDQAAPAAIEYQPFTLPEGINVDEEILGEFTATAKELGLSQEGAQKLADIEIKAEMKRQAVVAQVKAQWAEQSKADPEFGGERLSESLGTAKKAMDAFATPEMRKLLNESGFGNHPEVIRHFIRVGKAISEDGRIVSGTKAAAPSDPAKRLFPNQS